MKRTMLPVVFIGVGLLLMGTSIVWSRAVSNQGTWTDEQAQEFRETGVQAHALGYAYRNALATEGQTHGAAAGAPGHHHEGVEVPEDLTQLKAKLDEVLARRDRLAAQLETARRGRFSLANLSWWVGMIACGLGIAGHFVFQALWARRMLGED